MASLGKSSLLVKNWVFTKYSCRFLTVNKKNLPTMIEVTDSLFKIVGGTKAYRPSEHEYLSYMKSIIPPFQEELPPRYMKDSYGEAIVPLGSDELLRDKYLNRLGGVRIGRILEDLDLFSVWLCYKHVYNPKQKPGTPSPFCMVTALVDQINLAGRILQANQDIRLSGRVSWVGKTSLETSMKVTQETADDRWEELIEASFVMVSRDPLNIGAMFVNPLVAESAEEKVLIARGEVNKARRLKIVQRSLLRSPPTQNERALIHDIYLSTLDPNDQSYKSRILPEGSKWMSDVVLRTTAICHPQERNLYYKVFGGFLMRQAVELAWVTAYVYSKTRPLITNVDDIIFQKPVDIGSVLYFTSQVVYVDNCFMLLKVSADQVVPETGMQQSTNVFHFCYTTRETKQIPQVLPMTYGESMMYLDGKRHFNLAMGRAH